MACPMCPFLVHQKERSCLADMPLEDYSRLMDELGPSLLTVSLWGWGEPLLNKELPEMIRCSREYGVFVSVSTNAYAMDREWAGRLIDSGLDYIILSVDGATDETYTRYRGKNRFDRVTENIRTLQEERRRRGVRHPFTNLQFIVMRDNEHEVPLVRELARDLGVDKLSLKKVGLIDDSERETTLPRDELYIHRIYKVGQLDDRPCSRPWNTPLITARGDVIVCCGDIRYVHNFGNVFDKGSFREIWNCRQFRDFRRKVIENINQIAVCRHCPAKSFEDGFV